MRTGTRARAHAHARMARAADSPESHGQVSGCGYCKDAFGASSCRSGIADTNFLWTNVEGAPPSLPPRSATHVCAGTAPRLGSPLPHLHREWSCRCHIGTAALGLGSPLPTSALGLGSPLPTSAPGLGYAVMISHALMHAPPLRCAAVALQRRRVRESTCPSGKRQAQVGIGRP
jgi:hypothetical protein